MALSAMFTVLTSHSGKYYCKAGTFCNLMYAFKWDMHIFGGITYLQK